jgi:hypothetical protein
MTGMDIRTFDGFSFLFMLAVLLATFAALAQEEFDEDAFEPAVDTSAELGSAVELPVGTGDEREAVLPAAPSAALAADVTRQQSGSQVMDRMELGRTEITGNQELPKVMYIVPWQRSDPGDLIGRPVNTLLDEVLAPLDRDEFVRQVIYYGDLYGKQE